MPADDHDDDPGVQAAGSSEDRVAYFSALPRRVVAAGALIRDSQGRVCLVEPVYKDVWLPPGGIVEPGESPSGACAREVREELGLDLPLGRLLCLDWVSVPEDSNGRLVYVYDGGVLTDAQVGDIRLPSTELKAFAFVHIEALGDYVSDRNELRLRQAVQALALRSVVEVDRTRRTGGDCLS